MVCVDDMAYYTDSQRSREKKPQTTRGRADVATHRMRRYADILLPCANRRHGGLAAILHALRTIADINRNLSVMAKYLIYAQITRLTVILPTVLFGIHTLQPVQILFDGLLVDLIFACLLLCRIHGRPEQREQSDSWGVLTAVEAIASGAMLLTAFLFIYHHDPSSDVASSALFLSVLLIQATAFLLHWNPVQGLRVAQNRRSLLIALSVVFLSLLTAWIFGWNKALGFVWLVGAYWYLLLIAPLSVILAAVVIKIYRAGKNR